MSHLARAFLLLGCLGACAHAPHHPHWAYEGKEGPAEWGALTPEFSQCREGAHQSPVDLASADAAALPALEVHYQPLAPVLVNNGHTVQDTVGKGNTLQVGGRTLELAQFHFHHASEHTLSGRHLPLELHFVHRDDQGKLSVLGLLVDEGAENPGLGVLLGHLPKAAGQTVTVGETVDLTSLLPADRAYFQYEGSLTTPPCTEGVTWFVLQTPIAASRAQLEQFARVFENNSRPTMPLNDRHVLTSR